MKALLLEDHSFFGDEIKEYLVEEHKCDVSHAHTYDEAIKLIKEHGPFEFSFLDILLQNGRTGIDIVNAFEKDLGKVLFVTGCVGDETLDRIKQYNSVSKLHEIWPKIESFLGGNRVSITD